MLNLLMEFYIKARGVEFAIKCTDEVEYQSVKKFLLDMDPDCGTSSDRRDGKPAFFYLQTEQQMRAVLGFVKSLRKGARLKVSNPKRGP